MNMSVGTQADGTVKLLVSSVTTCRGCGVALIGGCVS
jgi:hypothetical protein